MERNLYNCVLGSCNFYHFYPIEIKSHFCVFKLKLTIIERILKWKIQSCPSVEQQI